MGDETRQVATMSFQASSHQYFFYTSFQNYILNNSVEDLRFKFGKSELKLTIFQPETNFGGIQITY